MEPKDALNEFQSTLTDFKSYVEREIAEVKKNGHEDPLTKAAIEKIQNQLDAVETKLNRPAVATPEAKADEAEQKEMRAFLAKGVIPAERKDVSGASNAEGAYLIPTQLQSQLIQMLVDVSPVRQLSNQVTISVGNTYEVAVQNSGNAASWVGETAARPATTSMDFGKVQINVHELYAMPKASATILEDSAVNVESEILRDLSEQFSAAEGLAFVSGDGNGKPEGFLANTDVEDVTSGTTADFDADDLIELLYTLKPTYLKNATFCFSQAMLRKIRKMKANNEYIWSPMNSIVPGVSPTLLDRPYVICPDMTSALTAGSKVVAVGDFKAGYTVVDKRQITVLRDIYTVRPFVGFYTTKRVGGKVVRPEAIKYLVTKA